MNELNKLSIYDALSHMSKGDFTPLELLESHIEQVNKFNGSLNAYITTTFEIAKQQIKSLGKGKSGNLGKLSGIPIGYKDIFCTKGVLTTNASKMLANFIPNYESTVTKKLNNEGAIMLGKLNCDQFGMGSATTNSIFGATINPWTTDHDPNVKLSAGGSSGGSAAAVASFMAMASLGTDTGGSVRQPAAFCGLFGIKPTYGACSRWGIISFASSLDQAGVLARSVQDGALVLESMIGFDQNDSTSVEFNVPCLSDSVKKSIKGLKIGIPFDVIESELLDEESRTMCNNTIDLLKQQGAEIVKVDLPNIKYSIPVYHTIAPAEASSNLARYDGVRYGFCELDSKNLEEMYVKSRSMGFGKEVKKRIMVGTYVLSSNVLDAYYHKAQKVRRLILNDFKSTFEKVESIVMPTTLGAAFPVGYNPKDPTIMYMNDILTTPASLAGLPASSVPAYKDKRGLPRGMQVLGRHFDESRVIQVSSAIERGVNMKFIPGGF
jgi:aspartyl-tRNA(Asn)/glutamyl-tRNA(Gln) amidotransferase subunit A